MSEPNFIEATVFVYRHKQTGQIRVHYRAAATALDNDPSGQDYEHVASLEPRAWIQAHYAAIVGDRCPSTGDMFGEENE